MVEKCLSFDDMYELASCEELNDENKSILISYNAHIINCSECALNYKKIAELYELINSWTVEKHASLFRSLGENADAYDSRENDGDFDSLEI